jgi:preprotein translocase subunit SecG
MKALTPYIAYFDIALIILGVALVASILMQVRGAGLGSVFGGTGTVFKTKRGIERLLFNATIIIATLFAVVCFFTWAIPGQ